MMRLRFGYANTRMTKKYSEKDDPLNHLGQWTNIRGTKTTTIIDAYLFSYFRHDPNELVCRDRDLPRDCFI